MNLIDLEPLKLKCNFNETDNLKAVLSKQNNEIGFIITQQKKKCSTYHTKKQIQELIKYLNEVVEYMK